LYPGKAHQRVLQATKGSIMDCHWLEEANFQGYHWLSHCGQLLVTCLLSFAAVRVRLLLFLPYKGATPLALILINVYNHGDW
jgi:hypothetical protein